MTSVKTRKKLALGIFALAILMALPPGIPFSEVFTDLFLNLPLATYISENTGISIINSLVLTYTLIPVILIYLASVIYPANTEKTFSGFFTKIKNSIKRYIILIQRQPIHLLWIFGAFYVMFLLSGYYKTQINIFLG